MGTPLLVSSSRVATALLVTSVVVYCGVAISWSARVSAQQSLPREAAPQSAATRAAVADTAPPRAVVDKFCVSCHSARVRTAGLVLESLASADIASNAAIWEKVLAKLRVGAMPPPNAPRPDPHDVTRLTTWLEAELDAAAGRMPNPGRTEAIHRLNRAEYQNAIRDVLGLEINVSALLPADDADGFDNMASLLSVSPALLERYLSVARRVSRLAVGMPPPGPVTESYTLPDLAMQESYASEDLPFGSRGGIGIRHYFPVDGEYVIKVRLKRQIYDYVLGLDRRETLEVRIDGARVQSFVVGGEDHGRTAPQTHGGDVLGSPEWERYALTADDALEVRVTVKAGPRIVGVSYVGMSRQPEGVLQPRERYGEYSRDETRDQAVETVAISGPFRTDGPGDTPSRRTILTCRPGKALGEEACARRILTGLARTAFRRPPTPAEARTLVDFFRSGRRDGGFDAGIQFALERMLADPNFLFRTEQDPAGVAPKTPYQLSDLELASRLSFFLWSSVPDAELLTLAEQRRLRQPRVLEAQVKRMLADRRSAALIDNFAGQWLLLRNLRNADPTPDVFPEFDESLREAFRRETTLFLESQLRDDRSVVELLNADYTFVNERLARHYGIRGVYGSNFRRVTLPADSPRRGLLGQGSVLMVTSYPNRTSPVLRGKWVLENVLGTPPPQPPPNVPSLKERRANGQPGSVRQLLEEHRSNPSCAVCHAPMDPLGFALENFDAIGQYRTRDGGVNIDAAARLPDGTQFTGPAGLRAALTARPDDFVETVTEKLFAYALGRGVEFYDRPIIRQIARGASSSDHRWSALVAGIVNSPSFRMRMSRPDAGTERRADGKGSSGAAISRKG
jgi:mono/diheme cytochrome c family protein